MSTIKTYRLEMLIVTNFQGTLEEAQDKLQDDATGFEQGDAGWFSENYIPEDPYLVELEHSMNKE